MSPAMASLSAIQDALRRMFPRMPAKDLDTAADHAVHSPGLRPASAEAAAWLSAVAYARHAFTDYDTLLDEGYGEEAARYFVVEELNRVLAEWGCRRRVDP
jgi:hypothetical protein